MDIVSALSSLGSFCCNASSSPVIKHVAYPFTTTSNTTSLKYATEELRAMKQDINNEINDAQRTNGEPTDVVQQWLHEVEAIERKAADIQQNYQQLRRCLCNICPNLWSNYKISRSATKAKLDVKSLCDRRATFQQVTRMQHLSQEMPTSSSIAPMLESVLSDITNDENTIIGIWGMGGIGKTHLLKQIYNKLLKDGPFQVVVFVTCSQECSDAKIQHEIIKNLHLQTMTDSVEARGSTILHFLQEKSFVLLLDDLWGPVELTTIGIPVPARTGKIVLATRSSEVCGAMRVSKLISVNLLDQEQALSLFMENVTERTISSHWLIQQYAKDMVRELGGLPLALIAIGKTMSNKTTHWEWEYAVGRLEQARLFEITSGTYDSVYHKLYDSVYHKLMLSYDNLNTTLQQCFLHCSLWPENHCIEKSNLIELWMGLGLIDEPDDIHTAYNTGYSHIGSLEALSLLETIDDSYVKMHDVIRDMALWIARNQGTQMNQWIVPSGTFRSPLLHVSPDTVNLSLMYSEVQKVLFSPTNFSTPCLSLLIAQICDSNALPFESLSKLKVLDLSGSNFEAFPVEICHLVNLEYLNLSQNEKLSSLPQELGTLDNLKYLLLRGTPNCTIPVDVLPKLHALRLVDLTCDYYDNHLISKYHFTAISSRTFTFLNAELLPLFHFQALGITIFRMDDFQQLSQTSIGTVPLRWLKIDGSLYAHTGLTFSINFFDNIGLVNNLLILQLKRINARYVEFDGSNSKYRCCLKKLEELSFVGMPMRHVTWKGLNPTDVFQKLQVLKFKECYNLRSISWVAHLPWIQELEVSGCRQIISICDLDNAQKRVNQPYFRFLKKMRLVRNNSLQCISYPTVTCPALEILEVESCNELKKLPFKTDNPPRVLSLIGTEEWWNNIEMDDIIHRTLLQPFFQQND